MLVFSIDPCENIKQLAHSTSDSVDANHASQYPSETSSTSWFATKTIVIGRGAAFYKFATRYSKRQLTALTMDMFTESAHGLGVDGGLM